MSYQLRDSASVVNPMLETSVGMGETAHGFSADWASDVSFLSLPFVEEKTESFQSCFIQYPSDFLSPERLGALPSSLLDKVAQAVPSRKAEYLAVRHCAAHCMTQLKQPPQWVSNDADRCPIWPIGLTGSLSHTAQYAIAIVGNSDFYMSMGIDIEGEFNPELCRKISHIIYGGPSAVQPQMSETLQATLVFSAKESLYKALFPLLRTRLEFSDARCVDWDLSAQICRLELNLGTSSVPHLFDVEFGFFDQSVITRLIIDRDRFANLPNVQSVLTK